MCDCPEGSTIQCPGLSLEAAFIGAHCVAPVRIPHPQEESRCLVPATLGFYSLRALSHSSLRGPFSSHGNNTSGHSCIKDLELPTACFFFYSGNLRSFSFTDKVTYNFPIFPCFSSDSENEVSLSLMEALLLSVLPAPSALDHLISSFFFSTFLSSWAFTLSTNTASLSYRRRPCHTEHLVFSALNVLFPPCLIQMS